MTATGWRVPRHPEPVTEVDVVAVEEEGLVHQPDCAEHLGRHQQTTGRGVAGRPGSEGRLGGLQAVVNGLERPRRLHLTTGPPHRRRRVGRQNQRGHRSQTVRFAGGDQVVDEAGPEVGVVVDEEQKVAAVLQRTSKADVVADRDAAVDLLRQGDRIEARPLAINWVTESSLEALSTAYSVMSSADRRLHCETDRRKSGRTAALLYVTVIRPMRRDMTSLPRGLDVRRAGAHRQSACISRAGMNP